MTETELAEYEGAAKKWPAMPSELFLQVCKALREARELATKRQMAIDSFVTALDMMANNLEGTLEPRQ